MQTLLDYIIQADEQLFLWLNNLGSNQWDSFWLWITDRESWFPFYAVLLLFSLFRLKNWKLIFAFAIAVALLITLVDQSITTIFKPGFARFRPCHYDKLDGLFRVVKEGCGGKYSFFSSHSANSFALAFFLTQVVWRNKLFTLLMFTWATFVAYSRIYVGVHYPIDITVGAIWGCLLAWLVSKLYNWIKPKII